MAVTKKLFIDNCILSVSDTLRTVKKQKELYISGVIEKYDVLGYERIPFPSGQLWKTEQLKCLPTLGRLARNKDVSLFKYDEIIFEQVKRKGSFPAVPRGNVFEEVTFVNIESAIDRSLFIQMEMKDFIKTECVIDYCNWLLSVNAEQLLARLKNSKNFLDTIDGFNNIDRFRSLCKGLSSKQYPDAFHLWAAERAQLDYFVTIDSKFINAMTKTKRIDLPCTPISPKDMLNEMHIEEYDGFDYEEGRFYMLNGTPC